MKILVSFFEKLFYNPSFIHRVVAFLLLPLSFLYAFIMLLRRFFAKPVTFDLPIISIGNLTVGGSGKTPFIIALCKRYDNLCVISRGYGRRSSGMIVVSKNGTVLTDVEQSGDEAMLIAKQTRATVIVSEDREKAIAYAKAFNPCAILLDDAFSQVNIKKYELLLYPADLKNYLPLPSGPFREFAFAKRYADLLLIEDESFHREVNIKDPTKKMVLVTAIANPARLNRYLPQTVVAKYYFADHAYFDPKKIKELLHKHEADSILVTQKDLVKIDFAIPLSVMELELKIKEQVLKRLDKQIHR